MARTKKCNLFRGATTAQSMCFFVTYAAVNRAKLIVATMKLYTCWMKCVLTVFENVVVFEKLLKLQ